LNIYAASDVVGNGVATTVTNPVPIYNEIPAGTKDGINVTFLMSTMPDPNLMQIFLGGNRQTLVTSGPVNNGQYTISGQTLTLGTAPTSNDDLFADYFPLLSA
jgi:hypothetical protein